MPKQGIIIECERMKYPYTGLHEYCFQLCTHVINLNSNNNLDLSVYVPEKLKGVFGKDVNYLTQHFWHKIYNSAASASTIWHGTYQGSNYFPLRKGIKKILTIHDLNFLLDKNKTIAKQKKYLKKLQDKIDRSDYLTVISEYTLNAVKENLNIGNIPVEVVYNGCNIDLKQTPPEKPSFINDGDEFLFSIGTIAEKKNFHVLPALLKGNNFKLVIAGINQDQNYYNRIVELAKTHQVEDRLILPGSISSSAKWWLMQNTKAFLFPSIAEGFGIPLVEAMNFGIPIIASDHTCLPEIGSNAVYYFRSFDEEDMRDVLRESLHHFETNASQKEIVLKRAKDFDWNVSAKKYIDIYNKLS